MNEIGTYVLGYKSIRHKALGEKKCWAFKPTRENGYQV